MNTLAIKHLIISFILVASTVAKADLITSCMSEGLNGDIKGSSRMDESMPIASVSKIFTSLWAAERLKLDYRFPTQVYLTRFNNGSYNVHLRGSLFPYFDRTMLYFLIGELNKRGVKSINELTFDENFKFASLARTKGKLVHQDGQQTEADIIKELTADVANLDKQYSTYLTATQPLVNMQLPTTASLTLGNVATQSMHVFDSTKTTSSFMLRSSELYRTLKELNRNSHNFATDTIFDRLSRTEKFTDFMTSVVGVSANEFSFVNGSGYPKMFDTTKVYNSATCRTVITVVKRLTQVASQQQKDLQYLLPVAGADAAADGDSTVTTLYLNDMTKDSVLAKTGTITPSISLAGVALTKQGMVFFHTSSTNPDSDSIRKFIADLIQDHGGSQPLQNAATPAFVPFDENSVLDVN